MAPGHVAYGMRAQYGLLVSPDTVMAWERGLAAPEARELTALAGVRGAPPATSWRPPRPCASTASRAVCPSTTWPRRVGLDAGAYRRMEDAGRWRGNERQSAALADLLQLPLRDYVTATGQNADLSELLRSAVTTRWQAYVKPTAKLLPLSKQQLEQVLDQLHTEYQEKMVGTLNWNSAADTGDAGRAFLDRIVDRFWELAHG